MSTARVFGLICRRRRTSWPFDWAIECPELIDRGGHVRRIATNRPKQ